MSATADNIERACDVVLANRRVTINEVQVHLHTRKWCMYGPLLSPKPFLSDGTQKLTQCWTVCVDKLGDNVEK